MMISLFVAIACAAQAPQAAAPAVAPSVAPEAVAQVADAAAKALPASRRLECHVSTKIWNRGPKDPPVNFAKDTLAFPRRSFTFRMFGPGRTVLIDPGYAYAHVEAGGFHYGVATGEGSAMVDRGSHDPTNIGLPLALQIDHFAPFGSEDSADAALRSSIPISLSENGTTRTYRFIARGEEKLAQKCLEGDSKSRAWQREIVVDVGDPPRVLGYSLELPARAPGKPTRTDRWTVEAWQMLDGKPIPSRVRREVALPDMPDEKLSDGIQIQITEITDLAAIPADVPTPRPVAEGTRVSDARLKFDFVVGSPDITYQGRALRLKEPLWVHPGDKLDELLKSAVER
ncbi:MAG: hypothetical protein U0572_14290 [Phycisphaerales bacterium]